MWLKSKRAGYLGRLVVTDRRIVILTLPTIWLALLGALGPWLIKPTAVRVSITRADLAKITPGSHGRAKNVLELHVHQGHVHRFIASTSAEAWQEALQGWMHGQRATPADTLA